jgi:serine phosphatase RsbU (regulator of sigma subunit)
MIQPLRYLSLLLLLSVSPPSFSQTAEDFLALFKQAVKEKDYNKASLYSYETGKLFSESGNADGARKYLSESISYSRKSGTITQSLLATHLLGTVLYNANDFADAADQFSNAAELAKKINSHALAGESLILKAKSLRQTKKYKRAIEALEEALSVSIENKFTSTQLTIYDMLSEYYALLKNPRKSAEYKGLYNTLFTLEENERKAAEKVSSLQNAIDAEKEDAKTQKEKLHRAELILSNKEDSLHSATQSLKVVEESLKELEEINHKRQLEIDLLNKEKEISGLRIKEQTSRLKNEALLRNFILVVVLLGTTLAIVVVINYRKTVKINRKLDLQHKNIKSSINYAKRIQEAMLPKKEVQENYLKESFVLFRPRDVVSGDFYWFSSLRNGNMNPSENDLAFGAIDCTGHGVPGAFMSMIGINSLNSILNRGITETNRILDSLHLEIRNALQQEVTGNNDGMDAALCIYRKHKKSLEFSGAKSPLVYIQNDELFQVKGDIHPIGGSRSRNDMVFKKNEISIHTETMVYLFTDGFKDQFGGSENQKFMSKRFTQLLREIHKLPLSEQKEKLNGIFEDWKGKNEQTDDVLIIGVKITPDAD